MFAQAASHGLGGTPPKWGYAGTLIAGTNLPVSRKGSIYIVDGSGTINRLTPLPKGAVVDLYFNAAPTLVHSSLLLLPGSANITVDAGSVARFISLGNGVWQCEELFTTYGRQIGASASAAAARTVLGLASVPREVLTANRTYYVRTDGSDSNNGLANTSGGAFLTIQKAIDTAVALDLSIYSITINVADGTYTGAVVLKPYIGVGPVYITGNTGTPSNVVISTTTNAVSGTQCGSWTLQGMKLQTATSGHCVIVVGGASNVTLNGVYFGASAESHIVGQNGANITVSASYTISGGAINHYWSVQGSRIYVVSGITVTLSGTPAFTIFTTIEMGGIWYGLPTFSGSASAGTYRYSASLNGVIQTYGSGASYFPGGNAGVTATGGQYA